MDPEFEAIRSDIDASNILLNICANNEHVPEAEHLIYTVKER